MSKEKYSKKKLSHLFKGNNKKYLDSPLDFDSYFEIIKHNIKNLNSNLSKFKNHYDLYLELFNKHSNLNTSVKNFVNQTNLGFWSLTNSNIKYYISRGWNKADAKKMIKERQSTWDINKVSKTHNCSIEDARLIISERSKKAWNSTRSRKDWEHIKWQSGNSNRFQFYLNKINPETGKMYTEYEAKLKIKNKQAKGLTSFWNDVKCGKKYYTPSTSLAYFLNKGLSLLDAKRALYDKQCTFSLEKCIQKYRNDKGIEIFNKRQEKWQKSLNNKTEEEKLDIKIRKLSNFNVRFYSNESIKFFDEMLNILNLDFGIKINKYLYKGKELFLIDSDNNIYFYDFCIPDLKFIIEYNGSHIHPNKNKLNENEWKNWKSAYSKESADLIYKKNMHKLNLAKNNGYKIYEIWDNDNRFNSIEFICKKIKKEYDKFNKK